MQDPYSILGVAPNASDDEIKKAYRELAKKYHPDNYTDSPLADIASEKMKEINQAYDEIQKMRTNAKTTFDGNKAYTDSSSTQFADIRTMINAGHFTEAEMILDYIAQDDRNAEWNFLKGCILTHKGWYFDARRHFETACYMDPDNEEYRAALQRVKMAAGGTTTGYRTVKGDDCSMCDCCSSLICADCLCECCGGDLIRCC
ncbi:MAG: J domain-containing protein [Clostridiales bacterium]|nr:J domain-containing protein [Clostridiales bacterium]